MNEIRRGLTARLAEVDVLAWIAMALLVAFSGFITMFVSGYAVADPGGWLGIGGPVVWALFMIGLGVWALYRPGTALMALAVAGLVPLAFGLWYLVDYNTAWNWEDGHGPFSLILVVAVSAPAAVAGLFRPREAGFLTLVVSVVPVALRMIAAGSDATRQLSISAILLPIVISGVLFLVAAGRQGHRRHTVSSPRLATPH